MSNMAYIRDTYGVPAKRGGRIKFQGKPGTILSVHAGHLVCHIDGDKPSLRTYLHPRWEMEYEDAED